MPSDAERCRAQAAECRRKAKAARDLTRKNELREMASYWDDLRSHYEAFERFKQSDQLFTPRPPVRIQDESRVAWSGSRSC